MFDMTTEEMTEIVIENVRRMMAAKDPPWTQGELARRLDVERGTVSRLLAGKHIPTADTLVKLASALEVQLHELVMPVGSEPPEFAPPKKAAKAKGKR